MSTLIFPLSPTHLDKYTDPNNAIWQYDSDGPYWNVITSTTRKNFSGVKLENTSAFSLTDDIEIIEFDTFEFNIDNYYRGTPGRVIVPSTGFYRVFISIFTGSQGNGSSYTIEIKKNGLVIETSTAGPNQNISYDQTLNLNEGDYVEVFGKESTGTGTVTANSNFVVYRVGFAPGTGISNHAAFSGARAILNASSNATSTPTAVSWNDVDFNANANVGGDLYWYNTEPNRLTVKADGYYKARCFVQTSSAGSLNSYTLTLRKTTSGSPSNLTTINMSANDFIELDEIFELVADDIVELMLSNSDNTGAILDTSYLELVREGV